MRRPLLKWVLIVGVWTLFGSLIAGETYFSARARGGDLTLARSLIWYLAYGLSWAVFTPLVLWLRRRFPLEKGRWASSLAVHIPASMVIAWVGTTVYVAVGQMLGYIPAGTDVLIQRSLMTFVVFLHFDPALYWIIIGLSYVAQYYKESRERELRASHLETQLAESRLKALEMQLHPHFLFNALHTIAVLVRTNRNSQAVRVVTGLGELLRRALDSADAQVVPLKQELEFIERYLEIEQLRFGDRLKVEMRIQPETLDARVPYLILQPLVENAIRHGIAPRASAELLKISARREGELLRLEVRDNGPGLAKNRVAGNGVGLPTTRERLRQLYGDEHRFDISNAEDGGVVAALTIPFQLSADEWQRTA